MYERRTGLVLGFHGCDESVVEGVLTGKDSLKSSKNTYDWLGSGIYFWEHSYSRALEYAHDRQKNSTKSKTTIKNPAVVGAILDLGNCLDLLDYQSHQRLRETHSFLKFAFNPDYALGKRIIA